MVVVVAVFVLIIFHSIVSCVGTNRRRGDDAGSCWVPAPESLATLVQIRYSTSDSGAPTAVAAARAAPESLATSVQIRYPASDSGAPARGRARRQMAHTAPATRQTHATNTHALLRTVCATRDEASLRCFTPLCLLRARPRMRSTAQASEPALSSPSNNHRMQPRIVRLCGAPPGWVR